MIRVKRIYELPKRADGFRVLVDRLWPRGLSKSRSQVDLWLKEIAPSHKLRSWFSHEPKRWEAFKRKYQEELNAKEELARQIKHAEKENGIVTLLYAAKDRKRNNALVLTEFLRKS